jgi:inner membrane protein YhjD
VDLRARVDDLHLPLPRAPERQRPLQRGGHRAAAGDRAAAVEHAREEALLERVGEVLAGGEPPPGARGREQLEHGLAVAVLQVLAAQAVAVGAQQPVVRGARHERDLLGGVRAGAAGRPKGDRPEGGGTRPGPALPAGRPLGGVSARGRPIDARASARARPIGVQAGARGRRARRGWGRHTGMSHQTAGGPPSQIRRGLSAVDGFQQRRRGLAFTVAVLKKFDDDQGVQLGALIAYYGFFSLFPLLLVFVTVLGFVLQGNPSAQESVLHSTLSQFPIIGNQLEQNVHSLKGSGVALGIGLLGALLAGLGITGATRNAFDVVWKVPRRERSNFVVWRLRGLALLATLGVLSIVSTAAAGYVTAQTAGAVEVLAGVLAALAANLLLFFTAFRLLTVRQVETRDLLPGVVVATVLWQALEHVGGYYVDHVVRHAQQTSGLFAFVLGLLTWLYLGGQVTVLAAEVNVVRAKRMWPRKLF